MSRRAWATIIVVVLVIIAASLFFLQDRGEPRPTTYGDIGTELGSGRIARPQDGFAVTLPDGWRAWTPSTGFQDWWGAARVVSLWMEPGSDSERWWMGTCGIGEQCTRERMVEAGGEAYCWMLDDTDLAIADAWTTPEIPAATTTDSIAEQAGWTEIRAATEELPAGTAVAVRAVDPNGWDQTIYHLTDGERWLRLICGVLDSDLEPRTIAETIEFTASAE